MKSGFAGFPPETLKFLRALKKNNRREWFEANKQTYLDSVKAPMEELVATLSAGIARFAPAFVTEPKRAIYRIYRDTRFSPDKTPYKTHVGALFSRADLPRNEGGAFYFQVSQEGVGIAGGVYMPQPDQLLALRTHLAERHEEFRKLTKAKAVIGAMGEIKGEKLSRPPKGFSAEHPAVELLKGKQWYFWRELDPRLAETPKVYTEVLSRFEKMAPIVEFLNVPLLGLARKTQRMRME
jgi:uncharacterized protein (TIGR02453 family)